MMKNWKKMIVTAAAFGSLALFAGCTTASAVSLEEAKDLVKSQMGDRNAVVVEQETDREDGVYELEIVIEGVSYDFEVDSRTGEIREVDREDIQPAAETQPTQPRPAAITMEEAKAIAYGHAGVREADALDRSQERDDGIFEIDFEHGGWEYDYDIAPDGTILKSEKEPEPTRPAETKPRESKPAEEKPKESKPAETKPREQKADRISAEKALSIALEHAGVTEVRDRDVEWDDGRWEVSFESGRTEYDYDISADGKILRWEKETDD